MLFSLGNKLSRFAAFRPRAALILCSILVLWPMAAAARSVTVTVTSGHKELVGATVRILELNRVAHTGEQGRFTFVDVPSGNYTVFAGLIGYASAQHSIEVNADTVTTSLELAESAIPMKEVVVSASPFPKPTDELYQPAASKSQVELLGSAGTSFSEKLSDVPGVTVRSNGTAPTRPILRGLSDNRVLVLENGLRTGDIATYDPAHATPIEAIGVSEIDVVRGPASILYGPSTIGGLVNVLTDMVPTVSDHRWSGTIAGEGNTVSDQYAGYFNTVLSSGRNAFRVSAGGHHAQDIRIPSGTYVDPASGAAFDLSRMPQTFDRSSEAGLGYSYQTASGMIGVGGKHYEMNYGIPGVPPNADWMDAPPGTSRIAQKRNTAELRALLNPGATVAKQWSLDANFNDYNHSEFPTAQDSTGVSDPQANHFHKKEYNAALQLRHRKVGKKLEGVLGLWTNIEDLDISGDQPLGPNSTTSGYAGYVFEEYTASPTTRIQAGLRYDYNKIHTNPDASSTNPLFTVLDTSRTSNAVTASAGVIHNFSSEVSTSLNAARSFRAPTVQELFAYGVDAASGTFSIGDADLGPETGFGLDLSLKGNYRKAVFEVSPYYSVIHDYIYAFLRGDTLDAFPVRQFAATDARLYGFEAAATVQAMNHVAIRVSSDYVNAEDTKLNVPLPFTPPLRGLVRATYQDDRYMAMIEWRGAATQNRLGDGDTRTPGWGIANIGVGRRFVQGGMTHNLSLHADNLFNRRYADHLSVVKDFLPMPGLGVRLNYELLY
jgi:iron complex outermembrane receptor protein